MLCIVLEQVTLQEYIHIWLFNLSAFPVCKTYINDIILVSANVILKSPQINFENTLLVTNVPFLCVHICF